MNNNMEYEYKGKVLSGFAAIVLILIIVLSISLLSFIYLEEDLAAILSCIVMASGLFCLKGLFVQEPNEARAFLFFGNYVGSCHKVGFWWVNPFFVARKLSLRIQNMDIDPIKVNDKVGNPVLIGMVLVWKIKDTYKVTFDLDSNSIDVNSFVRIQSDAALREVTGKFAYDCENNDSDELTLRDGGSQINDLLEKEINNRLDIAGLEVVEARINYLAYAPEIAAVMLRRQQASAIISAREKIVEGAVTMVEMALRRIEDRELVELSNDEKAKMVGNLLVVLCSDEPTTPMLNTTQG